MKKSEEIKDLAAAFSKAQGEYKPIKKRREVDFTDKNGRRVHYMYADLADVIDMSAPILSKNGISTSQHLSLDGDGTMVIETLMMHSSGQWMMSTCPLKFVGNAKEIGSEITYFRRYTLCAALGIHAEEDDDGTLAVDAVESKAKFTGEPIEGEQGYKPYTSQPKTPTARTWPYGKNNEKAKTKYGTPIEHVATATIEKTLEWSIDNNKDGTKDSAIALFESELEKRYQKSGIETSENKSEFLKMREEIASSMNMEKDIPFP